MSAEGAPGHHEYQPPSDSEVDGTVATPLMSAEITELQVRFD